MNGGVGTVIRCWERDVSRKLKVSCMSPAMVSNHDVT